MTIQIDAKRDSYDVVVIGSGLGGLTAAALLAQTGRSVLVVERHNRLGGYAHSFSRKRQVFDSAVHLIAGAELSDTGHPSMLPLLLDSLGVADRCAFHRLDLLYRAAFPGLTVDVPTGPDFLDVHARLFPREKLGLRRLQRLSTQLAREVMRTPPDLPPGELRAAGLPLSHEYRHRTAGSVFDDHLRDPRLKALLGTLWPYLGVPPSKAGFDTWAPMLMNYVDLGVYYCAGSFQNLVNAIGSGLTDAGGELLLKTTVRRILVQDGRIGGVVLDNGQRIRAETVISNADPVQTCAELIGTPGVDTAYLRSLRAMRPSLSAAVAFLSTDMDLEQLDIAHETFLYDEWDHDVVFQKMVKGEVPALAVTVPTLSDPTLSRNARHLVTLSTLLPYDAVESWRDNKSRYERLLLDKLEQVIPGINDHIDFIEGGTPRTMERYTLNLRGAIYGWEHSPEQSGTDRMPHRGPVDGLYFSGHWTQPGGGVLTVVSSGIQTAELVAGHAVFAPDFQRVVPLRRYGSKG
ncbi:prolycopene isomerase [Nocardia tenerifensis]|uniref:Prolycopene isomerase n=1 Tax=Nocardia tenerifensis TaxID=228006 RepID=A0A318KC07_9NOCA|nr:NAD(P)/FAD-dependent oxidoreductase [Nocardia tenerifensis]PXX55544.1 prolycopene isomerase [Nocardia tenerifensis]